MKILSQIKHALFAALLLHAPIVLQAQGTLPVRGFSCAAPKPDGLDAFIKFVDEELAPRHVNTLILRVGYNYQYASHPELRDSIALSMEDIKRIVATCRKDSIRIIPQINLLGHQSGRSRLGNLLRVYPQFDETPWVQMPQEYKWPNPDGLYCKSYCPLHPDLHKILFEVVDELCDVFEADAFHAGMDEVFYLGDSKCPRCGGKDNAELFAGEVTRIRDHLASKNRELWIWGDRLIDGKTTGLGIWEASYNNTYRAVDMIPKDVVICDWHYERPDKTAVYFALKGFRVVTCPWRRPAVASVQVADMFNYRQTSTKDMKDKYQGIVQTTWSAMDTFLEGYYANEKDRDGGENTQWHCFRAVFDSMNMVE